MLDKVDVVDMRKYAGKCFRYMFFYRMGCSVHLATYATKVYRGHRMIPGDLTHAKIEKEYDEWAMVKAECNANK